LQEAEKKCLNMQYRK